MRLDRKNFFTPPTTVAVITLIIIAIFSLLAPYISDYSEAQNIGLYQPGLAPNADHFMGTNESGQDVLTRLIWGLRSSLYIGLLSAVIATFLGVFIGSVSGFIGGKIEQFLMSVTNVFIIMPSFLVIIIVNTIQENRSLTISAIIIASISWSAVAKAIHPQVLILKEQRHIDLARLNGYSSFQIMKNQIAPYLLSYIFVAFTLQFSAGILYESTVSMIGLGPEESVTLGKILNEAQKNEAFINGLWWSFLPPTFTIIIMLFSLFVINSRMSHILNPKHRER